jgi:hypothetical protein
MPFENFSAIDQNNRHAGVVPGLKRKNALTQIVRLVLLAFAHSGKVFI